MGWGAAEPEIGRWRVWLRAPALRAASHTTALGRYHLSRPVQGLGRSWVPAPADSPCTQRAPPPAAALGSAAGRRSRPPWPRRRPRSPCRRRRRRRLRHHRGTSLGTSQSSRPRPARPGPAQGRGLRGSRDRGQSVGWRPVAAGYTNCKAVSCGGHRSARRMLILQSRVSAPPQCPAVRPQRGRSESPQGKMDSRRAPPSAPPTLCPALFCLLKEALRTHLLVPRLLHTHSSLPHFTQNPRLHSLIAALQGPPLPPPLWS